MIKNKKSIILFIFILFSSLFAYSDYIYVVNYGDSSVSVIDTDTNGVVGTLSLPVAYPNAMFIAVTPQGDYALTPHFTTSSGTPGDAVSILDLTTDPENPTLFNTVTGIGISSNSAPSGVTVSPDGNFAYVATYFDQSVAVIDTNPTNTTFGTVLYQVDISSYISGLYPQNLAVNPAGTYLYVCCQDPYSAASAELVVIIDLSLVSSGFDPVVGTISIAPGGSGAASIYNIAFNSTGDQAFVNVFSAFGSATAGYPSLLFLDTADIAASVETQRPLCGTAFCFYGSYDVKVTNDDSTVLVSNDNTAGSTAYYTSLSFVPVNNPASYNEVSLGSSSLAGARGVMLDSSNQNAYVALYNENQVEVVDVATQTVLISPFIPVGNNPNYMAIPVPGSIRDTGTSSTDPDEPVNGPSSEKCFIHYLFK